LVIKMHAGAGHSVIGRLDFLQHGQLYGYKWKNDRTTPFGGVVAPMLTQRAPGGGGLGNGTLP
jgi:hypothetical protein